MNAPVTFLDARRTEALQNFRVKGVPHRRIEEWKYSDLRSVIDAEEIAAAATANWQLEGPKENVEIADLSGEAPEWARAGLTARNSNNAMESASLAFAKGGVALRVPRNTAAAPLRLNWSGPGHARVVIILEEGASLTLIERQGAASGFRNAGMEILLSDNAQFTHIAIAEKSDRDVRLQTIMVSADRNARYNAHLASFGGRLSRFDITVMLEGEGSEAKLNGVNVLGGETHSDVTTHIVHATGRTHSIQLLKNVAAGKSRAVYQGKITVREGANASDSRQTAKGIILGERAEIDLKPELEIFADDVKCAHGAAVGDLEAEQLFYLRARGVPEAEARNILIRAFLEDAVLEIMDETLRAEIWRKVETALGHLA